MSERAKAVVKWYDSAKGYGFVTVGDEDAFLHHSEIKNKGSVYRVQIADGQPVTCEVVRSEKGLKAVNVNILR